jgi:predicted deacylase
MPVHVIHGRRDGPTVFVSAAVHGDEINGVEIIRRLLHSAALRRLAGTLLLVPIVNLFGFHNRSRYLPDRRDLNRSFPGNDSGSMASRLAHVFSTEIVAQADIGIDLHTAAVHRVNLPQVRADISDPVLKPLAQAFSAPVLLHSAPPEGSLRAAAAQLGASVMVYEAGEALRFDERSIRVGLRGVLHVLNQLGMLARPRGRVTRPSAELRSSSWLRAPQSGVLRAQVGLGDLVAGGDTLALVADASGASEMRLTAPYDGVIIGRTNLPLVFEGEAVFHLGRARQAALLEDHLDALHDDLSVLPPETVEEPPIV